jgi:ATP-dependent 26S proteasome regulatory subunit
LLRALNRDRSPAIVVLEDIDQLFESRVITPQYLLNVLDGLLTLPQVILWVATTNDPTTLALNLLDRPGRFDRVVVFPEPAAPERRLMLRSFSKCDLSEDCLDGAVYAAEGLSGAHLREVCGTVTLAVLDGAGCYEDLLLGELHRIQDQHRAASRYDLGLKAQRGITGFATGT